MHYLEKKYRLENWYYVDFRPVCCIMDEKHTRVHSIYHVKISLCYLLCWQNFVPNQIGGILGFVRGIYQSSRAITVGTDVSFIDVHIRFNYKDFVSINCV
jgi:hypothetical protein